jgi:glycosyltransferase involved in cell wall biosynthesis
MMDERIHVLLIIFSFDIEALGGGISQFAVSLSKAMDPIKFQISLCGLWNRGTQIEADRINQLNEAGIQSFSCAAWDELHPYRSFFKAYCRLRTILKINPIDIIHSHSLFGDIAALLLHFEGKAPVISRTLHNELRTEWSRRPLRRLFLTNFLYPLVFDVEIGVSQYIADGLNGRWLAKRLGRQALTIYNAIDIDRFRNLVYDTAKIKRELGIPGDGFLIGSVGRLTKQKGYDLLLEATSMATKKIPQLYCVIIGDGEDANKLKQQAVDLNIGKNVIFTGMRPDVNNLLHAFDLFVCSSRWEGLSTALMEAMAVEIPILATDIPGNLELLQPGVSAWFVTAEDSGELARGVIKAHQNPEQNKEFARNAFARLSKFRIEQIAIIHEQLYQLVYLNKKTTRWLNHRKADALINNLLDNISKS